MHTHEGSLSRAALLCAGLLAIAATAVFLAPRGTFPVYGLNVPGVIITGGTAIALLYPIFACFCAHTLYHHVLLLDAGLKERFDRAARDSVCLFDERRGTARRELRTIPVDTMRAAKHVQDLRAQLMALGWTGIFSATAALGLQSYVLSGLPTLAVVMVSVMLCEVGGLLLRCCGRIGRDFLQPGPTAADYDRLDADVETFELRHRELLLGGVDRTCRVQRQCRAA
jgi:hypothetical protein